jgi:hypothetical protein
MRGFAVGVGAFLCLASGCAINGSGLVEAEPCNREQSSADCMTYRTIGVHALLNEHETSLAIGQIERAVFVAASDKTARNSNRDEVRFEPTQENLPGEVGIGQAYFSALRILGAAASVGGGTFHMLIGAGTRSRLTVEPDFEGAFAVSLDWRADPLQQTARVEGRRGEER